MRVTNILWAGLTAIFLIGADARAADPAASPASAAPAAKPAAAAPASDPAPAAPPVNDNDVINYLDQTISWRHGAEDADIVPANAREGLLRDAVHGNSRKILQNSFDFAHAICAIDKAQAKLDAAVKPTAAPSAAPANIAPANSDGDDDEGRRIRLQTRMQETAQQIDDLNGQIASGEDAIHASAGAARATLQAKQESLKGSLRLAQAQQDLLKTMMTIFNSTSSSKGGIANQIARLEQSVQEELNEPANGTASPAPTASAPAAKPAVSFNPLMPPMPAATAETSKDDGIFGIISDMFTLAHKQKEIGALKTETAELKASTRKLIGGLRTSLQDAMKAGNALAAQKDDAKGLSDYRIALDNLVTRYKLLSSAVIPLGQITASLDTVNRDLKEWDALVDQQWKRILNSLLFRLVGLALSLLVPFILSDLVRRATVRYVQDPKRQRQLRILRQVIFSTVLVIMVLLNFVTEFGSLATYAGFLTAGLAVALQTVLLSLTAHFFFFGRFGVRTGDRVSISGVTGDVIQVGMLRIYLMELVGEETELRPSGRIVAFPNSVLFNATAFSKQVSGANYTWSELPFIIDPDSDHALASKKIMDAVNEVYGEYKEAVDMQHTALVESTRLSVKVPAPRSELRFVNQGLAFVVYYPLVIKRAGETRSRIMSKLIESFQHEPTLRLVIANPLKILAVAPPRAPNAAAPLPAA